MPERIRKAYLKEHRPALFAALLMSERLAAHLCAADAAARREGAFTALALPAPDGWHGISVIGKRR